MWGSLLSAALLVLAPVQRAEVRFGVVQPEGPGAAAVKDFRGCQLQADIGSQLFCYHQFFHAPLIFAEVCLRVLQGEEL